MQKPVSILAVVQYTGTARPTGEQLSSPPKAPVRASTQRTDDEVPIPVHFTDLASSTDREPAPKVNGGEETIPKLVMSVPIRSTLTFESDYAGALCL